jgi:NAD(P)H-dependent flavin oxidoreductase YrpB (nitropropane dioxygenase family)
LRLRVDQLDRHDALLRLLQDRWHWLVLHDWHSDGLSELLSVLNACGNRQVWLEVTETRQLDAADGIKGFAGWIARGSECGGRVGVDSAFSLAQRLATCGRPFLVQGGIGPDTAAACRAAGAAGVVLEEQLWLMRESPLPDAWRALLARLAGPECKRLGTRDAGWRVAIRPDLPAGTQLNDWMDKVGCSAESSFQQNVEQRIGWGPPEQFAWPVGQAIGLAGPLARHFKTTGRLVRAIIEGTAKQLSEARRLKPLIPESPLAASHGTRYPIVQGPMTRVSDRAEFAVEVAKAGGLPFLALALLDRTQTRELLGSTQRLIGARPWGVGLLGFIEPERRREQLEEILLAKPPFALIAGGRPDQAAELEGHGIPTYLHVPLPGLLRSFWEQGTRRFVFEGSECGGHVGPLTSFTLWQSMTDVLLEVIAALCGRYPRRPLRSDGRGPGRAPCRIGRQSGRVDGHRVHLHPGGRRVRGDHPRFPAPGRPMPRDSLIGNGPRSCHPLRAIAVHGRIRSDAIPPSK